jgi:hypothetical protein
VLPHWPTKKGPSWFGWSGLVISSVIFFFSVIFITSHLAEQANRRWSRPWGDSPSASLSPKQTCFKFSYLQKISGVYISANPPPPRHPRYWRRQPPPPFCDTLRSTPHAPFCHKFSSFCYILRFSVNFYLYLLSLLPFYRQIFLFLSSPFSFFPPQLHQVIIPRPQNFKYIQGEEVDYYYYFLSVGKQCKMQKAAKMTWPWYVKF